MMMMMIHTQVDGIADVEQSVQHQQQGRRADDGQALVTSVSHRTVSVDTQPLYVDEPANQPINQSIERDGFNIHLPVASPARQYSHVYQAARLRAKYTNALETPQKYGGALPTYYAAVGPLLKSPF